MSLDTNTALAIIGMALATYLTRIAGLWLGAACRCKGQGAICHGCLAAGRVDGSHRANGAGNPAWQRR